MQREMGTFRVPIEIGSLTGDRFERLEAGVDTGATYTCIPRKWLEQLGVEAAQVRPFVLADGHEVTYHIAWVRIRINGQTQPTIAVFGDPGSEPLLGAVTLEEFGLAADPVAHRLIPVPGLLKAVGGQCARYWCDRAATRPKRSLGEHVAASRFG